jgi:hypothetical protein
MGIFQPTHVITTDRETVEVMLTDDGAAYTAAEWEDTLSSDYSRADDGSWLFQGQAFNGRVETTANHTQRLYREAEARVRGDERLAPFSDTILAAVVGRT